MTAPAPSGATDAPGLDLEDLEREPDFALLGPGFGRGFRLLRGLSESAGRDAAARLVFAPFESAGDAARVFGAREVSRVRVAPGRPGAAPDVTLHARQHRDAVESIREAIAAGDVYQVCYTVRATLAGPGGADLVRGMSSRGLPRFLAWVRLPSGEEFVSASPELFFEVQGRRIRTEPMKGTADATGADALALSGKDAAELAMITDLLRNDLAAVCLPRSVTVVAERRLVRLPYAVQTVSDIAGELRPGCTVFDALRALHPGGSVTGAPKEAALEMIARLEEGPRGAYCGTVGLVEGDRAVFSLLIRTAQRTGTREWTYGVGGGIVYDSDADLEMDELRVKLGAVSWDIPC